MAQPNTAAVAGERAVGVAADQHRGEHRGREARAAGSWGRTPRWSSHQVPAPRAGSRATIAAVSRTAPIRVTVRQAILLARAARTSAGRGAVPSAPAGGSHTATASTSSVTQAVPGPHPAVAGVELVQAGQPLHAPVVGQRPAGPAGVGQGDGEGRPRCGGRRAARPAGRRGPPRAGKSIRRMVGRRAVTATIRPPVRAHQTARADAREDDGTQR